MITFLYASLLAVWLCWLIYNVVKMRRIHQVKLGDGDVKELIQARSAHSNAVENIPIMLILLFGLEFNGGSVLWINVIGVLCVISRVIHGYGIVKDSFKYRALGMQMTLCVLLGLIVANILYAPLDKFLTL